MYKLATSVIHIPSCSTYTATRIVFRLKPALEFYDSRVLEKSKFSIFLMSDYGLGFLKVNLVQEACIKCFAVQLIKFEILQTTWNNKTKNIKVIDLLVTNWKLRVWCFLSHLFHVICKISNFNMWTAKHLMQASCTELTLSFAVLTKLETTQ